MELQQHIAHPHLLVFNEDRSDQTQDTFDCSGCGEMVLGPCFSCVECKFYLHKKCAEAPMQIDHHPFHHDHPLILRLRTQEMEEEEEPFPCNLCDGCGMRFMYHCSHCKFYLHINCALLIARDTAGNVIETRFVTHPHPLFLLANDNNDLQFRFKNSCCSRSLVDASYGCFCCNTLFHKKCLELPIEINHPYHRKHQLILEFMGYCRNCNLCESDHHGYFYRCSLCNVYIHSRCAWPPPFIEDTSHHEHPFTLLFRPNSFTCDACGTQGNNVSYICSTCNLQVHKKCISLPRFIGFNLHYHAISHNFFLCLHQYDSKNWDCRICFQEVNMEHGSYYCSKPDCNFVVHVNCAIENKDLYDVIELENEDEVEEHNKRLELLYNNSKDCITRVIKEIKVGEDVIASEIIHISHGHNLTFSNEIKDNKHCNGCILPILSSFYSCSLCDFFLHKACAELPRKKLLWCDALPFTLRTNDIFNCCFCQYECSGFSYKLHTVFSICLRCAGLSYSFTYQAHEPHHLFFDRTYIGQCSACGSGDGQAMRRCKDCNFALDNRCVTLPHTAWHKCDKHSLRLVYRDYNDYPLQHYCDICEERRDPNQWFYHCEVCDTSVHPECVLGEHPFVKIGSNYTYKKHQHPLTFVQKIYYYPHCVDCGEPCQDLSLECVEHGCNYIVHWKCIKPFYSNDSDSDSGSE